MEEKFQKPEGMADFFDLRADGYDNHMKENIVSFEKFYALISDPVKETQDEINILDLGCGTGLELESILKKVPNADITGVDMSLEMLNELGRKYKDHRSQLNLIQGSYTSIDLGHNKFDYVISVMTMHHLLYANKIELYKKIKKCLKKDAVYIEGDFIVSPSEEKECLLEYEKEIKLLDDTTNGLYHIDIPFCVDTQFRLLKEAGFEYVDVIWREAKSAIIVAKV
jgi:tRNA (cmo5U34)-methyltransferase